MTEAVVATEPRTLSPPHRHGGVVTQVRGLGEYVLLSVTTLGAPAPCPGQFYMLSTAEGWGGGADERPYLPRAFSYARARPEDDGVELDFLLEDVGPGTHRLALLAEGEALALLGPLGKGWRPATRGRRPLLVGGGIGVAPLLCLEEALGRDATVLLGFRSAGHAAAASLFAGAAKVATDDGSAGRRGLVTELLDERLDRDASATVFACGPPAMLEAVRALCAERRVPAQLAMESGMACGFGACFGCVVPTRTGYVRLCVDGPVLDADRLDTAAVRGAGH